MPQDDARRATWCLLGSPTAPGRAKLHLVAGQLAKAERQLENAGAKRISREDQCGSPAQLLRALEEAWTPRQMVAVQDKVPIEGGGEVAEGTVLELDGPHL